MHVSYSNREAEKKKRRNWCRDFSRKVSHIVSPRCYGAREVKEACLKEVRQDLALENQKGFKQKEFLSVRSE